MGRQVLSPKSLPACAPAAFSACQRMGPGTAFRHSLRPEGTPGRPLCGPSICGALLGAKLAAAAQGRLPPHGSRHGSKRPGLHLHTSTGTPAGTSLAHGALISSWICEEARCAAQALWGRLESAWPTGA